MWQPVGERVTADPEFQKRFADVGVGPVRNFAMGSSLYHATSAVGPKMGALPDAAGARWAFWNWCSIFSTSKTTAGRIFTASTATFHLQPLTWLRWTLTFGKRSSPFHPMP